MAEFAGSIAGIVAFGAQTLQASVELKQLWCTLKDAPDDVKNLIDEISYLYSLLAALKQQHDEFAPFALSSPIWEDCCQRCSSVAADLESVALDLKQKIQHWRAGGSLRVLFKKEVLAKYSARLASTKTNLILAQSAFNSSIQLQQLAQSFKHSALLESVETRAESTTTSRLGHNSRQLAILESVGTQEKSTSSSQQLSVNYENTLAAARRKKREKESTREYLLKSPWLGKIFQIRLTGATCTWGITITQHNILPRSAPIWELLRNSDVDGVRQLFSSGAASIYDVHEYRWALLDYAVENSSLEVVQTLLQEGARPTENTLNCLYHWRCITEPVAQTTSLARLLISQSDHLIENPADFTPRYCSAVNNAAESVEILLSEAFPPYRSRPVSERARIVFRLPKYTDATFFVWLGQDVIDGSCLGVTSQKEGQLQSLLANVACDVGFCGGDGIAEAVAQRTEIIGQILKAGGIDAAYDCGKSILIPFMKAWVCKCHENSVDVLAQRINVAVCQWLEVLVDAGADLERIAEGERRCFQTPVPLYHIDKRFPEISEVCVLGLRTGPQLEDWQVYFCNPLDEWACDFWHLLEEGSEPSIPGSWIDEEGKKEDEKRSELGIFKSLATSRRKRRRYLRTMGLTDGQAKENLGFDWDTLLSINTLRRGHVLITAPDLDWWHNGHWPQLGDPCGSHHDYLRVRAKDGSSTTWPSIEEFYQEYCQ